LVWRIRVPTRALTALLFWFLAIAPSAFLLGLTVLDALPSSLSDYLQIALFHIAATLAYIVTYSALEARSPSLTLVRWVAEAGGAGRLTTEILATIGSRDSLGTRIDAAVHDGLAARTGDTLGLTDRGRQIARVFQLYRRLLGTSKGG
jgi:hypothetical protein